MPDGSYSIDDIQDYFEFIIRKHETLDEDPPVELYPNRINNRIVFKIKIDCKLELLTPETMRLSESTKKVVVQDKNGKDVLKLESVEIILVHCHVVNNNYQQALKVLFTFVPNKQPGQLINIALHSLIMLSTTNTELSSIEVWFTDQKSKPLEIEDNVNLTLIIVLTL